METKYIDTPEWDKTFALSDKVNHKKVSFTNRYGIRLVGDLYMPKNHAGKLPAIAVCGPYGAVKEQASGLYAQTLAERGFITLAFDPSFSGESGGQPRYISSGEIYTEDYGAAVDFFMLQPEVDRERIGILGICGFGGISINAAVQDTRIKATVSSTMGAFDPYDKEQRYEMRRQLNEQRTTDLLAGRTNKRSGGVPANLPDDAPGFMRTQRRRAGKSARRRSRLYERLPGLLQDPARLPSSFGKLQRRLGEDSRPAFPHILPARPCRRNPFRRACRAWRKGLLASGIPGGFRQIERRQQGTDDHSRCEPYRLIRPDGHHSVRPD